MFAILFEEFSFVFRWKHTKPRVIPVGKNQPSLFLLANRTSLIISRQPDQVESRKRLVYYNHRPSGYYRERGVCHFRTVSRKCEKKKEPPFAFEAISACSLFVHLRNPSPFGPATHRLGRHTLRFDMKADN